MKIQLKIVLLVLVGSLLIEQKSTCELNEEQVAKLKTLDIDWFWFNQKNLKKDQLEDALDIIIMRLKQAIPFYEQHDTRINDANYKELCKTDETCGKYSDEQVSHEYFGRRESKERIFRQTYEAINFLKRLGAVGNKNAEDWWSNWMSEHKEEIDRWKKEQEEGISYF